MRKLFLLLSEILKSTVQTGGETGERWCILHKILHSEYKEKPAQTFYG